MANKSAKKALEQKRILEKNSLLPISLTVRLITIIILKIHLTDSTPTRTE